MAIAVSQAFKDAHTGPVDLSRYRVEVFLGSSWVDVSSYVEPGSLTWTHETRSKVTGTINANTAGFTLINDDGIFSPDNTAGPYYGQLLPNKAVRVSSVVGAESARIFTGHISNWRPKARQAIVTVTAEDKARLLRTRDIVEETVFNPIAPATGYPLTKVFERAAWLSGLRWNKVTTRDATWCFTSHDGTAIAPTYDAAATRAVYSTTAGETVMILDLVSLMLYVTPLKGKALAELARVAQVVDAELYFDAQGALVFRSPMYLNDSTKASVETITVSSLEDCEVEVNYETSKTVQLVNRAVVRSTPYDFKKDSAGNILEEEVPFKGDLFAKFFFNPGDRYPDYVADANAPDLRCDLPSGLKLFRTTSPAYPTASNLMLVSVDNADPTKKTSGIGFQAGYPVFDQTGMKVAFVNNGSSAEKIESLTLKSKLMRQIQRCESIKRNQASIDLYTQRDREISNDLIPSAKACNDLAAWSVVDGKDPKRVAVIPLTCPMTWLELNDPITVSETMTKSIPVPTKMMVKRITGRVGEDEVNFELEVVTPSPDFSVSAIPAAAEPVETFNANINGTEAALYPPTIIDGTQSLVGLNNIPAFAEIVNKVKNIKIAGSADTYGIAFDGSDIYVTDWAPSKVYKLNSLTGELVATQSLTINSYLGFMAVGKAPTGETLLYVVSALGKIYVIDVANFETGAFSVKADLSAAGYNLSDIAVAHGKLYVTATTSGAIPYLLVWDSVTATQQDAPNKTIQLYGSAVSPTQMAWDRENVYIPLMQERKICRYTPATNTLNNGYAFLGDDVGIVSGDGIIGLAHDGLQIWAVALTGKVVRVRGAASGIVASQVPVSLSGNGYARFDGTYIWISAGSELIQLSTSGGIIARYETGASNQGSIAFDGSAIWATTGAPYPSGESSVVRVPRQAIGRQF